MLPFWLQYLLLVMLLVANTGVDSTESKTITILAVAGWERIAQSYMQLHPDVTVLIRIRETTQTQDDFRNYMVRLLNSSSPQIDIYSIDVVWPGLIADWVEDLRDYPQIASLEPKFISSVWRNNIVNGKLAAIPNFIDFGLLYYRKDLLAKYNFTRPPDTWSEMEHMVRVIKLGEAREQPLLAGFLLQATAGESLTCNAYEWFASNNAAPIVSQSGGVTANSAGVIFELERLNRWLQDGIIPGASYSDDEASSSDRFAKGLGIFHRNWPNAFSQFDNSIIRNLYAATKLPGETPSLKRAALGGWGMALSKFSQNKALAADFMAFASTPNVTQINMDLDGRLSTRIDVLPTCNRTRSDGTIQPVICDVYPIDGGYIVPRDSSAFTSQTGYIRFSNALYTNINQMLRGLLTPSKAALNIECSAMLILSNDDVSSLPERCKPQCAPGQFRSGLSCLQCEPGRYSSIPNVDQCNKCAAGSFSKQSGSSACTACPTGTYQDRDGQDSCFNCDLNSYSSFSNGSTACAPCPTGTQNSARFIVQRFSMDGSLATFRPNSSSQCFPQANKLGSPGKPASDCPLGGYCCSCPEEEGIGPCLGFSLQSPSLCNASQVLSNIALRDSPCVACSAGSEFAITSKGWYDMTSIVSAESTVRVLCDPPEACGGGLRSDCNVGYKGVRCGDCQELYYRSGDGLCLVCPDTNIRPLITVAIILIPIILGAVFLVNASKLFQSASVNILMDWAQTLSVIFAINVKFPSLITELLGFFRIFNLTLGLIPLQCISQNRWSFFQSWLLQLFTPFVLLGGVVVLVIVFKICHTIKPTERTRTFLTIDSLCNTCCVCLTVSFTAVTKTVFEIFRCKNPSTSGPATVTFLETQPSVRCGDSDWNRYLPAAIIFLIVYSVGLPTFSFLWLRRSSKVLHTVGWRRRWGSLFAIYRDEMYFWNSVTMFRRLFVILCLALFPDETILQIIIMILVILATILLTYKYSPCMHHPANSLAVYTGLHAFLVLLAVLVFRFKGSTDTKITDAHVLAAAIIVWIASVMTLAVVLRGIALELLSYRLWKYEGRFAKSLLSSPALVRFAPDLKLPHWALGLEDRLKFEKLTEEEKHAVFPEAKEDDFQMSLLNDTIHEMSQEDILKFSLHPRLYPISKMWVVGRPGESSQLSIHLRQLCAFAQKSAISRIFNSNVDEAILMSGGPVSPLSRKSRIRFASEHSVLTPTSGSATMTPGPPHSQLFELALNASESMPPFSLSKVAETEEDIELSYIIDVPMVSPDSLEDVFGGVERLEFV